MIGIGVYDDFLLVSLGDSLDYFVELGIGDLFVD